MSQFCGCRRLVAIAAVSGCVLACCWAAPAWAATSGHKAVPPVSGHVDQLFVQSATGGSLTKDGGAYKLVLFGVGVSMRSVYCCVSSNARVRRIPTVGFVGLWRAFGFEASPPDAVLNLRNARPGADTIALSLTQPRISRSRVMYRARIIARVKKNLHAFQSGLDRDIPRRFGAASLYIDEETARVAGGCAPGNLCQNVNGCEIQPYTVCEHANLSYANLERANLFGSDLAYANLENADIQLIDLQNSDLDHADLGWTVFDGASFHGSVMRYASFNNAEINPALVSYPVVGPRITPTADLTSTNLDNSYLSLADFSGADFTDSSLYNAATDLTNFEGATFCRTVMPDETVNNDDC